MPIANDISVATNGDIRYTGTNNNYTVIELHRYLQDLADNAAASGDDNLDITSATPSERSTDNIITLNDPYNIDDTLAQHLYNGSISQDNGDTLYSGLLVIGSVETGTQLQIVQNNQLQTNYWGAGINADSARNILLRIILKTRENGADIDGKRIRVQARELGDTYAEFSLTAGLGNSVAAISTSADLNNQTTLATLSAITDITNTEGLNNIDVDGDGTTEQYYSQWDRTSHSVNTLYEYTKYLTRRGSTSEIYGMDAQLFRGITHTVNVARSSSFSLVSDIQGADITFGNGATAKVLAAQKTAADTASLQIQLLTGETPSGSVTGVSSSTNINTSSVVARSISPEFIGTSTGSSIIGAFGVGLVSGQLTSQDQLFDLTNTLRVPPNNVRFIVGGLVSGEDRVLVGPADGDSLDIDQFTVVTAISNTRTAIGVQTTIPSDTPTSGTIRVQTRSGVYKRINYTSYSGTTFNIESTDFSTDPVESNGKVFISYIDDIASSSSLSFTSVYSTDRDLFIRVRDGGDTPIRTFETTGTLGSAGGSVTAIRTSDE